MTACPRHAWREAAKLTTMLFVLVAASAGASAAPVPEVPGGCMSPAAANVGRPGCFLSAELAITDTAPELFWHIYAFADARRAAVEAGRHRWAEVVPAHDRTWLFVIDSQPRIDVALVPGVARAATVGPLRNRPGRAVRARFMESLFSPGMRTRVHSHSGPEAFFVVDGEQCVETPTRRHMVMPGESFIVDSGPHLQASPAGRRSLVLVLAPVGDPWIVLEDGWIPSGFCAPGNR